MDDEVRRRVGQNVRAELARRNISQARVAEELGISQPQVSKRLAGEIAFDVVELERLARLLDMPAAAFMVGSPA